MRNTAEKGNDILVNANSEKINQRTTLTEIKEKAKKRRSFYANVVYDATEENAFFSMVESSIYDFVKGEDV